MKKTDFNKHFFALEIRLKCSKQELFQYLTSAEHLTQWFLGEVAYFDDNELIENGLPKENVNYRWQWQKPFKTEGEVLKYQTDQEFQFTFGKDFSVRMIVQEIENSGLLRLEQENKHPSPENEFAFINCCVCWTFFMTNLKSVIEHGIDLRETELLNESFINQ